jgi:hypothetical protein
MTEWQGHDAQQILGRLNRTVAEAAAYLAGADEGLCDGFQTAREVLSHLVFWHREYVAIAESLAMGRRPALKSGTFAALNAGATQEFQDESLPGLADRLLALEELLEAALQRLPDWQMNFPVKQGGFERSAAERVLAIESHIRYHVARLRRAARRGNAWLRAYYPVKA